MEKLHFDDQVDYRYMEQKMIDSLKADENVQKLLVRENMTENDIRRHLSAFDHYAKMQKACQNCKGLFECPFEPKGHYDDITNDLDFCQISKACRFQKQQQAQLPHKKNYLICDLSDQALTHDVYKIDLTHESEYYRQIVAYVKDWLKAMPVKGIYFHGGLGVGKTYLASCITNEMAKQGYKVAFVNMPAFCLDIKNNVTDEDYVENILRKMRRADCLVLDDIGAENLTAHIRDDLLFPLLDYRMEHQKRTIFTSNSDFKSLLVRMEYNRDGQMDELKAQRIMERVKTLAQLLPVKGESRRG